MQLDDEKQKKALIKAESLADDFDESEAEEFAKKHQDAKWYDDFMLLFQMITDDTFKLETRTYVMIAGALAYVVLPIDVIPDFIPGIGFVDDLFVIGFVMKSLTDEIERFKASKGML